MCDPHPEMRIWKIYKIATAAFTSSFDSIDRFADLTTYKRVNVSTICTLNSLILLLPKQFYI